MNENDRPIPPRPAWFGHVGLSRLAFGLAAVALAFAVAPASPRREAAGQSAAPASPAVRLNPDRVMPPPSVSGVIVSTPAAPTKSTPAVGPDDVAPPPLFIAEAPPAVAAQPAMTTWRLDARHGNKLVKLGRLHPVRPFKGVQLGHFRIAGASPPKPSDWTVKANLSLVQMYGNDVWGNCVIAGKFHAAGIWTGNESAVAVGTTAEAVSQYHAICGGGDPGCDIQSVLDYMKSHGLTIGGKVYKIDDYVGVDWTDADLIRYAISEFGAVTIGINLPGAWMNSDIWDTTSSGIVGGHDVTICGFDPQYFYVSTWGEIRKMTPAALASTRWVEEAYAILAPSWYTTATASAGMSPSGFDLAGLKAGLLALSGGNAPPDPAPIPVPAPPPDPTPAPAVGGSQWRDGSGVPAATLGVDGDFYLDRLTGNVYRHTSGVYVLSMNIRGPAGPQGPQGPPGGGPAPTPPPPGPDPAALAQELKAISAELQKVIDTLNAGRPPKSAPPPPPARPPGVDPLKIMTLPDVEEIMRGATPRRVPPSGSWITLPGADGRPVTLVFDPSSGRFEGAR